MNQPKNWEKSRIQIILSLVLVLDPGAHYLAEYISGVSYNIWRFLPTSVLALYFLSQSFSEGKHFKWTPLFILGAAFNSHFNSIWSSVDAQFEASTIPVVLASTSIWIIAQVRYKFALIFTAIALSVDSYLIISAASFPFHKILYFNAVIAMVTGELILHGMYFISINKMTKVRQVLLEQVEMENKTSERLVGVAKTLGSSVSSHSGALHETTASLDEIKATAEANLQRLRNSKELMKKFTDSVDSAREVRVIMKDDLASINQEASKLDGVVKMTQEKFAELAGTINEISNITQMVNDIVFQTKLLSFNASVEAARAGDEGKGFAVVAEEVGVLAQSSGKAAKDIEKIVADSLCLFQSVSSQLSEELIMTQEKITSHLESANKNIESNSSTFEVLTKRSMDVQENTDAVIEAIGEIDRGLNQIVDSMRVLSDDNDRIISSSGDAKESIESINSQVHESEDMVQDLEALVSPFRQAS